MIEEVTQVTYTHKYLFSVRALTSATIMVVVVMAGLYAILGLPPTLDTYYAKLYFHSIGIGLAAIATFLVVSMFGLQKHEPPLDFPIHYRAFGAVLFATAGGIFYLNTTLDATFTDIPLGLFVVAFILIGDVGGALLVQLLILPRKLAGTYNPNVKISRYFLRLVPTRREFGAYSKMGPAYWLALIAVSSAFIAGLIGFVNLWVSIFGLSFFSGYASFLGITDAGGALDLTLDPHSHEMALALMSGVVALVAVRFRVLDLAGLKKNLARVGLWIASLGVVAMTVVFVAIVTANYSPPTLLQNGPDGVNGIAGDDATMSIIALGALFLLVPLALTKFEGKTSWRNGLRLTLLGTWAAAIIISVVQALYIELHQDAFGSTLSANDTVFKEVQPMFGIFVLTGLAMILLAIDHYEVKGIFQRLSVRMGGIGLIVATLGAAMWTFFDPSTTGLFYWIHIAGVSIIGLSALAAVGALRSAKIGTIQRGLT